MNVHPVRGSIGGSFDEDLRAASGSARGGPRWEPALPGGAFRRGRGYGARLGASVTVKRRDRKGEALVGNVVATEATLQERSSINGMESALSAKKARNHTSTGTDPRRIASPNRTESTPLIIGLRTWR